MARSNQSITRFQRVMAALPKEILAPIITETFRQADLLRGSMILRVQVGKGTLRNSIRVEQGRRATRALVRAGGDATRVGGYDYANAQEFGTQKIPAQPFFWPSYRYRKVKMRREIKAAAVRAIKQIVPLT